MGSEMSTDFGDFNNDGLLDLIVTNFQDEVAILYKNEGNGFFSDITYISGIGEKTLSTLGWGTTFFDYDNDGDKDLFVHHTEIQISGFKTLLYEMIDDKNKIKFDKLNC